MKIIMLHVFANNRHNSNKPKAVSEKAASDQIDSNFSAADRVRFGSTLIFWISGWFVLGILFLRVGLRYIQILKR